MKRFFTFLLIFVFVSAATFAQEFEKQNADRNGNPTFVKFDTKAKSVSKSETKAVLSSLFNMTSNDEYKTIRSEKDQIGYTHERFQQYFKGIKVEHAVYVVHSRNDVIESMSGEYKITNDINVTPSVSSAKAVENAKAFINAQEYMQEDKASTPELVIVNADYGKHAKDVHEMVLAYKVNVYASKPLSRDFVYVNAHTGEIVSINAIIKTANAVGTADTRYSGTKSINTDSYNGSYRLRDYTRGNGIITYDCNTSTSYTSAVDFTDVNNSWTAAEFDNAAKDNGALDAHWAGMVTYDYFKDVHNRNSFDGNGILMKTYVHFDNSYENAYWNGSVFTFGDGASTFDILTSLDVFGHEFGHAVCEYTADLVYSRESGALNEAFSDIWGCAIEYKYAPTKDTWLMGEDIGYVLRDLSNPKAKGLPDTYLGDNWVTSSADYYGVHTNNGPFCHWFYLISVGGSGINDNNDSYTVAPIGIEKAEQITYRIESVYMTASSNYANARTYAIQAAIDLYGAGSPEEISVTNAMYAVGVGDPYGSQSSNYCVSKGTNFSYEWIAKVQLGTFSKTSTGSSYSDFTSSTINVNAGSTYAVTLTPGFASTTYNEYWKIWIDYDNNNVFDANELVYDAGALSKVAVSGNITIQSGISGDRRMRVSMKYNAAQTACETFAYGEVEDYTITIGAGTSDTQAPTAPTNLSSSNITETSLTLSWTASTDNVGVTGYDVYQNGSLLGSVTGTAANITGLTASTTYAYYVKAKDAAANVSAASSTLNVTTSSASATTDLTLTIKFDNYPEETSWTLKTSGGTSVAAGGTYASQADGSTLVIPINGLANDCYVFTMLDSYGDGICCSYGSGSYTLKVTGGATIASGGSFTSSQATSFCLPYTAFSFAATTNSVDNAITKPAVNVYPNPASSYINVQVTNAKANGMISIYSATGALVKVVEMDENESEVNISELPSGLYLITVDTKKEAITKQFIKK
jgi:Zn-dependent metalloprotease